jgi:uncharacterized membrane protein (UPF0127 family)
MKTCRVTITDTSHILLDKAEIAFGGWQRLRGLMGRKGLLPSEGLLIPHCNAVHTVFMLFPIDVVYLSKENRVLKIVEEMGSCCLSGCLRARSVLEMPAGWSRKTGLCVGHTLAFEDAPKPPGGGSSARPPTGSA